MSAPAVLLACALAFGWAGATSLALQSGQAGAMMAMLALSACALASELWLNRVAPARDRLLLPTATLLMAWSSLVIARVAPNFLARQTVWMVIGLAALCAVALSRHRLRWLRRFKYTWLAAALGLLLATFFFGVNPSGVGAPLWLGLAGVFLQPSEVLRLLLIAFLAAYYAERLDSRPQQRWRLSMFAPALLMAGVALALLVFQQDLGAGALLFITFLFVLYLASGRAAASMIGLGLMVAAVAAGAMLSSRVALRLQIWRDPFVDTLETSFQIAQSLITIASGGVLGQGLGQGFPAFVPAVHTDFPFAAIAEEFGLLGAFGVLALFAVLVLRGWRIARVSSDAYGLLLAGGIAASLAAQVFVIVGGNLALVPLTGVTLPLVSYGGSSLVVTLIGLGILIRLSADAPARTASPLTLNRRATRRSAMLCAGLLAACALSAAYWAVARGDALTSRDDNPRRVIAEQAIRRGDILSASGERLAHSEPISSSLDSTLSRATVFARRYPVPQAAPATGFYSLRYGVSGVEEDADAALRGDRTLGDVALHRPQRGRAVTTTLDLRAQIALGDALANETGAAVVMNARDGAIRTLASSPFYRPETLDRDWDALRTDPSAPLLNRATSGAYPLGDLAGRLPGLTSTSSLAAARSPGLELRVAPLAVAAALAELRFGAVPSPTLLADKVLAGVAGQPSALPLPLVEVAPNGDGRFVAWLLDAVGDDVIVIAVEQADADPVRARRIRAALPIIGAD